MNRSRIATRGAAAALLALSVPLALAQASPTPAPENEKRWFNRLRGGNEAATAAPAAETATAAAPAADGPSSGLEKTVAKVRLTTLGKDPQALPYLDLIERGIATAPQLNDFAAYVAYRGLVGIAVEFQEKATKLDAANATYWLNLGTLQRSLRRFGSASSAFRRAIELDPANALAYYNLGTVLDAEEDYDGAIEAFRRALVLDPKLADPRFNPQVVGNERMLVVKLLLSQTQAGALTLPLITVQDKAGAKQ